MLLALAATALVALALLSDLLLPRIDEAWSRHKARRKRTPALLYRPLSSPGPTLIVTTPMSDCWPAKTA